MKNIFGYSLKECTALMQLLGEPTFRGKQLYEWLYANAVENLDECTSFSKKLREKLKENVVIDHGKIIMTQKDPKDSTTKYLIQFSDGVCIETVVMYYKYGASLCVSSQAGCNMGCDFCASTIGGKERNLTAGEILDQIYLVQKDAGVRIATVVIMGIGEPLDNFDQVIKFIHLANEGFQISQRKITLSTCGLIPQIRKLAELDLQINLAISLHSPFQEDREKIMPIARNNTLKDLFKVCNEYFTKTKRRVTFEYALIGGVNDRMKDVDKLVQLLKGRPVHVNLIALNPVTENDYKGSKFVKVFEETLKKNGINCTIRRHMGRSINAACGQLRQNAITETINEV